jgi:hypothetical protein
VRRPTESTNVTLGIEHALTNNQTLRLEYRRGTTPLTTRASAISRCRSAPASAPATSHQVRFQIPGADRQDNAARGSRAVQPPGQRAISSFSGADDQRARLFNSGGAGVNSHGSSRSVEVADNIDFNIGRKHAMRVGRALRRADATQLRRPQRRRHVHFSSIAAFQAGTPLQFTQRIGR